MNHLKDQRGVALVLEVVLTALVLAAVGFAIYTSFRAQKAVNITPSPSAAASPSASPAAEGNDSYLLVKELGIKIPLTQNLLDLYYEYAPASGNAPARLYFSTVSISSVAGGASCTPSHEPLGIYTVYPSTQNNVGSADSQVGTLVTSANSNYVYYHHVQYACGDTPYPASKVASLIEPLHNALQNAKPAQSEINAITDAIHNYKSTTANDAVSSITLVGSNAKGSANHPGNAPSGYEFIAHKDNGKWTVVYWGQELPGKTLGEKYGLPATWYTTRNN